MKRFFLILPLILIVSTLFGQKGELGLFGGGSYYVGDINPVKHFLQSKAAFGIFYRYNIDTRVALQASYNRGKLVGDDAVARWIPERQLKFESIINDFSARFEFNFLDYFIGSTRSYFTTFIFCGISLFTFNPKADGVALRPLTTEGVNYSKISIAMPFGLGFKYSLGENLGIGAEWGMRKTATDYIDDVSTIYNFQESGSPHYTDPSGTYKQDMQRGNSQNNDWYNFTGIFVSYKFSIFSTHKCRNQEFSK
ncbi:MAG: DUF6089 family protein [Bacteroidetes bacterium]|nr:DUF6089 family protein [Bacteroidota bacterium]